MRTSACVIAAVAAFAAWGPASAQSETGGGVPSGRVISVNFASGKENASYEISAETAYGLVSASGWNNVTGSSGTDVALSVSGASETAAASMTFAANATWSYDAEGTDDFLRYFLGDKDGATINVTNIPFANYDVIVYLTTDTPSVPFRPVSVNGTLYIGDDSATPWKTVATENANATFGQSLTTAPAYGTNALRVTALSGDLAIQGSVQVRDGGSLTQRCNIAGFQIVEVFPSISVNFAGDASGDHSVPIPETSEAYGLFSVPGSEWKNGVGASGAIQVSSAYGSAETFSSTISYKSKNIYYDMDNDTLLKTYLDDGIDTDNDINGASISMDNVPFTEYAVIVYFATDNGSAFFPVTVNGKSYTWNSGATVEGSANFGNPSVTTPTLGQNALCVTGLSDDLTIEGGKTSSGQGVRGGIAAIQIICTGKVDASLAPAPEAETSVISLNFGSNHRQVPQTADPYGLVPVPGYTWTNISGGSGSQTVTVASGKPLTTEPTVAYNSAVTYWYAIGGSPEPFLYGYLDDGEGDSQDGVGASVTVSGLPFWAYDVVVYAGLGDNGAVARPVRINDKLYTWDDERGATVTTDDETAAYGGIQPTAEYGRNALRVRGVLDEDYSQSLSVQGLPRSGSQRGGIAAIQIVERKVLDQNTIGELATLAEDTPVYILPTAQIVGNLTLPPDAILDLSAYALHGSGLPITGTLTVNEGTQIRLPLGASWTIAGAIAGTLGENAVIVGGSLATGVEVNENGTITADATYEWTGEGNNDSWSNPYNWSSHAVPTAEADVTIPLAADAAVTIELPADAVAKSVTITGPESGTATLALTSAEGATGSLTVSGQMLTTGNVSVTQSADITVSGTTETYPTEGPNGEIIMQPCQAGFQVHQATWRIASGTLSMPIGAGANTDAGEAGVSGGGALIVGDGEDDSAATLAVRQIRPVYYEQNTGLASGTLRVKADGTLKASEAVWLTTQSYTVNLDGGIIETTSLRTFAGVTVSADSALRAPEGGTLAVSASLAANDALVGAGGVTLSGAVTVASALTDYDGTLTVGAGASLTLSNDAARPALVLADGSALTVTPSTGESLGQIRFPTTMAATSELTGVDFTVEGLAEGTAVSASVADATLTLSWAVDYPTLSSSASWSNVANWTNVSAGSAPLEGVAVLDGSTSSDPIEVTLDTALTEMDEIIVLGDVSLVTTGTQSTIPTCVTLAKGATLTVAAPFGGAWTLPAGTTLCVTGTGFSFSGLTLNGLVRLTDSVTGTVSGTAQFLGGLTVDGSNVTVSASVLDGPVTLNGHNISISYMNGIQFNNDLRLVNRGLGNRVSFVRAVNGAIAVEGGSLMVEAGNEPSGPFAATIAEDAMLTLEGSGADKRWNVTGEGALSVGTARPTLSGATLPGVLRVTATADEETAGLIRFSHSGPAAESGFAVEVTPAGDKPWVTVVDTAANPLTIHNVPPPNEGVAYSDDAELALRQAAAAAGLTGNYSVQVRTGGQPVSAPSDNLVSGILKCFTGIEPVGDAEARTVTLAYDFGITGVRVSDGQVSVTVKVQGAAGAAAGFAEGVGFALLNGEALLDSVSSDIGGGMATLSATLPEGDLRLTVRVSEPSSGGGGAE